MNEVHEHVIAPLVVLAISGMFVLIGKLLVDRNKLDKKLQAKEDEQQQNEISVLRNLITHQAQSHSETITKAVDQMRAVVDDLRVQISGMGDQMRIELKQCNLEVNQRIDSVHKRVTEQGEELSELKGEHKRNMETGQCFFAALSDNGNRDELVEYFKERLTAGRRLSDKHPLFEMTNEEEEEDNG